MYISLVTNDVKHLFLCLLASSIFFFVKCTINIFLYLIVFFISLLLNYSFLKIIYILGIILTSNGAVFEIQKLKF